MNGVRGDLTRPPLNTEHRKATLKPVEIYLYITQTHTATGKHTRSVCAVFLLISASLCKAETQPPHPPWHVAIGFTHTIM